MSEPATLLDPVLAGILGPVDEESAAAITGICLSHLTDRVLGPGSGTRHPAVNETAAPRLAALKLGTASGWSSNCSGWPSPARRHSQATRRPAGDHHPAAEAAPGGHRVVGSPKELFLWAAPG